MPRISFYRLNPCRSLDWRWQIARQIAFPAAGYKVRSSNAVVLAAAHFQAGLGQQPDGEVPAELAEEHPAIAGAYQLSGRADWERLLLESWILTGALSEEIASTCRVPEPVIDKYESFFFSIRNAIKATTYCWQAAIRCRRVSPKTPAALEKLIRQWAYFGGKYVLATALPAIGRHGALLDHPADLRTAEGRRAEHVRLAAKLFMAADDLDNAADLIRALPVILRAFDRMPAHQPACVDGPLFDVSDVISRRPGRSPARPARQAA